MERHGWPRQASRLGGVAVAGALLGWVISADLDWSAAASNRECAQSSGICLGIAPVAGLAFGLTLTVAVCWVALAAARIRPLRLTVPAAIVLMILAPVLFLSAVPGGRLHPAWAFSLVTAFALALPTLIMIGLSAARRARDTQRSAEQ